MTPTHKKEICRLLFLEGETVTETMRITKRSERAIDRYFTNFRQIFTCKSNRLSVHDTTLAAKLSPHPIEGYHRPFEEYAVTNAKFEVLLNGPKVR